MNGLGFHYSSSVSQWVPDINWLKQESRQNVFHTGGMVNCGQTALRKLAYSQAGQTLTSMVNEWEAREAYL